MTTATAKKEPQIEPFFRDIVDPDKDPGEAWKLGDAKIVKPGKKLKDGAKPATVDLNLILRRMPTEMVAELEELWKIDRELTDMAGNKRDTKEWDHGPRLLRFGLERCVWMWLDTENLVVGVGDQDALTMYVKAYEEAGRTVPPTLKVDGNVLIDGILNDDVKRHLMDRFPRIKSAILEAANKYTTLESEGEAKLRKN